MHSFSPHELILYIFIYSYGKRLERLANFLHKISRVFTACEIKFYFPSVRRNSSNILTLSSPFSILFAADGIIQEQFTVRGVQV